MYFLMYQTYAYSNENNISIMLRHSLWTIQDMKYPSYIVALSA
jgi:hypothetical protein